GDSETAFRMSSSLASILSRRFSYSFSIIILCVILVAFFMEILTVSMIVLACLRLTLFNSSAAVSRTFKSSSRWVLASSMVCPTCCIGVSGIGVSLPSCSMVLLGGVGSITGVALDGDGIGDPALTVSRALMGHGVLSPLFLVSICGLVRPGRRLSAGGAGLSRWGGGVRCIVCPSLL